MPMRQLEEAMTSPHTNRPARLSPARTGLLAARRGAGVLAARLPGTLAAARGGARWAVDTLRSLPDPTLRSLAATSVGLGAGLSFTRAGRLALVAGFVPAVVVGTAIAARPAAPRIPEGA
jgi:hypothetical protein